MIAALPPKAEPNPDAERVPRITIAGKPNAGKSSLMNRILGEGRMLVDPRPGTTRDAIDSLVERGDKKYIFVDTAGVRRKGGVSKLRAQLSRWYLGHDIAKPTAGELTAASHHGAHGSHGPSINGDGVDGHELDGPRHGSEAGVGAGSGADKAGLHH